MSTAEQHLGAIASAWPDIVGGDLAKRSRPIGIYNGALIIATPSTSIMQMLGFLASRITEEIPKYVAGVEIVRLRIRRTRDRSSKS